MQNLDQLELSGETIKEWLAEYARIFLEEYNCPDYDKTLFEEEWLRDYSGYTVRDAVNLEISYWD